MTVATATSSPTTDRDTPPPIAVVTGSADLDPASRLFTETVVPPIILTLATAPAPAPPLVKAATLVFDVSPWGVIYVDGKRHGTTPPVNSVDLPPGRHRIEVRNPTQPAYISSTMLEPGEVRPIRLRFE